MDQPGVGTDREKATWYIGFSLNPVTAFIEASRTVRDLWTASYLLSWLTARAVAYIDPAAGGSSGVYLARLFEKLGIAQQLKAKSVLVPGGLVAERVVSGQADIALHQISEILAVPGAVLVGAIPLEVQHYTEYSGGVSVGSRNRTAADALLLEFADPKNLPVLKKKGMDGP